MSSDELAGPRPVTWDASDDEHCDHADHYADAEDYGLDDDDDYCVHCECCCTCLSCEYGRIDAPPAFGGPRG